MSIYFDIFILIVFKVLNDSLKLCGHDATIYGSVNTPNSIISAKPGFIHLRFIVDKHNCLFDVISLFQFLLKLFECSE